MISDNVLNVPLLRCISYSYYYARKQLLLSARLSHRNSVCLSVRLSVWLDQSKNVQARITMFLPLAAWNTLVSGTVKLFRKSEENHSERGH